MAITTKKQVLVDGDDYQRLSSALELCRRYISKTKRQDRAVDEFNPKEVAEIESTMDAFWE